MHKLLDGWPGDQPYNIDGPSASPPFLPAIVAAEIEAVNLLELLIDSVRSPYISTARGCQAWDNAAVGTFSQQLTLHGDAGSSETLDGMVDTGAHFTVIPTSVLARLGIRPSGEVPVQFANGELALWSLGEAEAEIGGVRRPILVLFGSDDAPALIGAHTLEAFLLDIDVVEKKLVPKRALLMNYHA